MFFLVTVCRCVFNISPLQLDHFLVRMQNEFGVWEIFLPNNADGSPAIPHGSRVKVMFETELVEINVIILWSSIRSLGGRGESQLICCGAGSI